MFMNNKEINYISSKLKSKIFFNQMNIFFINYILFHNNKSILFFLNFIVFELFLSII